MRRKPVVLFVLAPVAGLTAATALFAVSPGASARSKRKALSTKVDSAVLRGIVRHRDETWRWQRLMGHPLTPHAATAARSPSPAYRRWVLRTWQKHAARARRAALNPPHKRAWLCIHRYEGRWDDPNPPYWGGLQMDLSFQRAYGRELLRRKGTADKWTPLEQMWVAERAYASGRGFHPWPNTARYCGLL